MLGACRAAEGARMKLDGLQQERDALIGWAARVQSKTDEDLDRQLSALDVRRTTLEKELSEVGDHAARLRELERLPALVEEY